MPYRDVAERLAARSIRDTNGCLIWQGSTDKRTGYGVIVRAAKPVKVHRAAWEVEHGPIPAGMKVCHSCDVRPCIELTHLWLGTQRENILDMYSKGRRASIGGWNKGRPHSAETRAKIGALAAARQHQPHSPETRAKIAASMRGNKNRRGH